MKINTKFLGEIECTEEDIVVFVEAISGFPELSKYIIIQLNDDATLNYLQSVDVEEVCFVITQPAALVGNYDIDISENIVDRLNLLNAEDALVFSILNIKDDSKLMTANLAAPIIINTKNNKAIQGILEGAGYKVKQGFSNLEELASASKE